MFKHIVAFGAGLALQVQTASAYDTETHALITRAAYQRSSLSDTGAESVMNRFGIDRLDPESPFRDYWITPPPTLYPGTGAFYYDDGGLSGDNSIAGDVPEEFEHCQMLEFQSPNVDPIYQQLFSNTVAQNGDYLPVQNWLVRGAIREDDIGPSTPGRLAASISNCGSDWLMTQQPPTVNDDPRSYNHFYDPYYDIGLTATVAGTDIAGQKSVDWALGLIDSFAPDPMPSTAFGRNTFSYADARNALWWALTREKNRLPSADYSPDLRSADSLDRLALWATTFRSLGDVVHLLEDAAQPQHTRNDPHSALNTPAQQAFEAYTNARVLGNGNGGPYVQGFFSGPTPLVPPDLGTYGAVSPIAFSTPLRFFTTRIDPQGNPTDIHGRLGLADYTNRGFFTAGTVPGSPLTTYVEPLPPADFLDPDNDYTIANGPCDSMFEVNPRLYSTVCLEYMHAVPDTVDPDYAAQSDDLPDGYSLPNVPIAADSILTQVHPIPNNPQINVGEYVRTTAISVTDLTAIGNLTIPRAVGYAAGMMDFFFRGTLTLSSPPDGLYAVVDQGTPHEVRDGVPYLTGTHTVFGFTTLRVRVKNTTGNEDGNLVESGIGRVVPQTMRSIGSHAGQLVAIAKYHRNPCYATDLSGESSFQEPSTTASVPAGCTTPESLRSLYPEISVSEPISVDEAGNLPGPSNPANPLVYSECANSGNINSGVGSGDCQNAAVLAEFNFQSDPIPINATDLYIQVAYRGPIGEEMDGIAAGIKDIVEPAYYATMNTSDHFLFNDIWTDPSLVDPEYDPAPDSLSYLAFCYHQQKVATLNDNQDLPAGEFVRVALLSDEKPMYMGVISQFSRDDLAERVSTSLGTPASNMVRQSDRENGGNYHLDPMYFGRGTTFGFAHGFTFRFYPDYDITGATYNDMWNLQPTIGGSNGEGISTSVAIQFTSAQDNDCHQFYPGAWPTDYLLAEQGASERRSIVEARAGSERPNAAHAGGIATLARARPLP